MQQVFVVNEAISSCCGQPVSQGKCTCGKNGHNPNAQRRPDYFGQHIGLRNQQQHKQTPLGKSFVYNFGAAHGDGAVAEPEQLISVKDSANGGLPALTYNWQARPAAVRPASQPAHSERGLPTYQYKF